MIPVKSIFRAAVLMATVVTLASLTACGGTKVYTADKTIVHKGSIYNISNVQRVSTRVQGTLSNGDTMDLRGADKKKINQLLDDNKNFVLETTFELDQQELVYQRSQVDSYRDYSKLMSNFESAEKKVTKFMADKKETQLKL